MNSVKKDKAQHIELPAILISKGKTLIILAHEIDFTISPARYNGVILWSDKDSLVGLFDRFVTTDYSLYNGTITLSND